MEIEYFFDSLIPVINTYYEMYTKEETSALLLSEGADTFNL